MIGWIAAGLVVVAVAAGSSATTEPTDPTPVTPVTRGQHAPPVVNPLVGPTTTFPPNPGGGHCGIWPGEFHGTRIQAIPVDPPDC